MAFQGIPVSTSDLNKVSNEHHGHPTNRYLSNIVDGEGLYRTLEMIKNSSSTSVIV